MGSCRRDPGRLLPAAGEGGTGEEWVGRHHPVLLAHAVRGDAGRAAAGGAGVRPRGAPPPDLPLNLHGQSLCIKRQVVSLLVVCNLCTDVVNVLVLVVKWRYHNVSLMRGQVLALETWYREGIPKKAYPRFDAPVLGSGGGRMSAWFHDRAGLLPTKFASSSRRSDEVFLWDGGVGGTKALLPLLNTCDWER